MARSAMMRHYLSVKEEYPDCIVMYRLGDFYEMFFDDAKKASQILDLTLTGRDCGDSERAPMCGVPYHAVDGYIAKLVQAGEKVAICEQLEDPATAKGIVERGVVRIVSAGTQTDNSNLDEKTNNFICTVYGEEAGGAAAWADITTGEFFTAEFTGEKWMDDLADTLTRIQPAEIYANGKIVEKSKAMPVIKYQIIPDFQVLRDAQYIEKKCEQRLKDQFHVMSLSGMIPEGKRFSICAAGAMIGFLDETQKHDLINIREIVYEEKHTGLELDYNAIRNLELVKTMHDGKRTGSLFWLLDKTRTGMGARLLHSWILKPLTDITEIEKRQEGVRELSASTLVRQGLSDMLEAVRDLSRLAGKIANNNILPKDALALGVSLQVLPSLRFQLSTMQSAYLNEVEESLCDLSDIEHLLINAIIAKDTPTFTRDGGFINDGFNDELDEYRKISKSGISIVEKLEASEREKTGIKNLKIAYNRVFGYYIEVTNSYKNLVPYNYVRKQTTVNAERYVTDELKETEEKILTAKDRAVSLENDIYDEIKKKLAERLPDIQKVAQAIARLDCILSFAAVAKENRYVCPKMVPCGGELKIVGGRHPVVEYVSKDTFVPNDTYMNGNTDRTMIITGPNMAGKSTYMRQVALISIMAHIGSFVPAKEAQIPILDKIFTRVGASDNLLFDQSTFMVEMTEVAAILRGSTENSLLILDEVGRGTSTYDGLSIAWAVVEYVTEKIRAKTLFATHYHELTELEGILEGVKNYKVTVREWNGTIAFLRKIARGGANRSFGVAVAALAGVPSVVTERANGILKKLEKQDITLGSMPEDSPEENETGTSAVSEIMEILQSVDCNAMTPMQTMSLLAELAERAKESK